MSKVENIKGPIKMETKGSGDHKRESGGGRNDRSDKSHNRSDSRESRDRSKLDKPRDEKEINSKEAKDKDQKDGTDKDATHHDEKSGDSKSTEEKKFTGRCRLFVGNLTPDVSEDEFKKMFLPYGEVSEVYVNTSRGFGFIRLDYRQNAEAAKAAIDGMQRKGRVLRVRFATHGAALRVKNLHPYVSNELLEQAFNQFGELERAIVIVDDRGKATGEGLVEFVRKPGAQQALRRINEGVFLFGSDPKPIEVEPLEQKDEEDGMPEKFLNKNDQYKKEREKEPRFAAPGSFEYEFGMRWKQIDEMEKKRIENVKKEMEEARIKLEDEMQNALYEFQAEQIRQDLLRQQEELRRLEQLRDQDRMRRQQELEMRMSRRAEEERQRQQEERRRQEIMMRQQEMQQRRSGGRDELMAGMRGGDMPGGLRGEMAGGMRAGDMSGGHRGGDMRGDMRGEMQMGMRGGDMPVGMRGGDMQGNMRGGDMPGGMRGGDMPGGMRGGDMPGGMRGGDMAGGMRGADMQGGMRGGDMPGGMRNDIAGGGMRGGDMRGEGQAFGPQGMRGGQGRPEPQPLMGTPARAGAPPMQPPPAPPAGIGLERGQQGMGRAQGGAPNGEGSPNSNIPSLVSQSGAPMDHQSQKSQLRGSPGDVPSAKHHRREASQFADADDEWAEGTQQNLYTSECQHGNPCGGHWPQPVDRGDNHVEGQGDSWRGVSLEGSQIEGRFEGEEAYERMDESGWNGQTANSESLATVDDMWRGDMPHSSNAVSDVDFNDRYLAEYSELCHNNSQHPASSLNCVENKNRGDKHLTNPQIVIETYQSNSRLASGLEVNLNESTGWADHSDTVSVTNQAAKWDYMPSTSPHQFDSPCKPSTSRHQIVSPCKSSTSLSQHQFDSPCKSSTSLSQHQFDSPCKPSTSQHHLEGLGVHHDSGDSRVKTPQKENDSLCDERVEEKNCGDSFEVKQDVPAGGDEALASEEKSAEVDEIDYSMALVPYVPPTDSSSTVSSPVSSPSPNPIPHHSSSHFPNVSAATGFPIHPNPLLGQPTYVRLHPLHIAAAVAAQHQTQAAAAAVLMQQRNRLAAVAMQQQAAAVAAAAARGRATLLHQQMVRNRYMGAPVLVRQPFVPLTPGIPGPVRVRMRVRRSVLLTEELSMGP